MFAHYRERNDVASMTFLALDLPNLEKRAAMRVKFQFWFLVGLPLNRVLLSL
jgi:hypothetical protein